jgi:hypothetical protein
MYVALPVEIDHKVTRSCQIMVGWFMPMVQAFEEGEKNSRPSQKNILRCVHQGPIQLLQDLIQSKAK